MIEVYIAAAWEDKEFAGQLRDALAKHGIGCTSRWISEGPSKSSLGDHFTDNQRSVVALGNVNDIRRSRALVHLNPTPRHKVGTGGRHWETGLAYGWGLPLFLVGYDPNDSLPDARSNIFHFLRGVKCFTWPHHVEALAEAIREACPDSAARPGIP
jgi:hypothetical protein